jgi:phosphoglycerate dehydrogenase-like enzyme
LSEPLVVGILYPPGFDPSLVLELTADCERPVEILAGRYEESRELRQARGQGQGREALSGMIPEVDQPTLDLLAGCEVVMALDIPFGIHELGPRVRFVQGIGAGVAQFDVPGLAGQGIRVATAAGVAAVPIAEFVMGRLLEVWKGSRRLEADQRAHVWRFSMGRMLSGSTIGIVGLGAIGTAVAQRAHAFGMRVIATRRRFEPGMTSPAVDELMGSGSLTRLLSAADAVVLSLPETADTVGLIGPEELAAMKPGAVLCNVARGSLIDEEALVAALTSGQLGAAILDVTAMEPLPAGSPLWDAPNLYLSPHSSASLDGYFDRLSRLLAGNLLRYASGDRMVNEADPEAGY